MNIAKCIVELNMIMKIAEIEIVSSFGYVTNILNGVTRMVVNGGK